MATKLSSPLIHFELPEDTTGNYKAKCKYCNSCISGSSKTSSNFTTHLKRKHPKIYEEAQKSGTIAKAKVMEQATVDSFITGKKYDQNDVRQCRAIDALTSLIAENMLPLSIVESLHLESIAIHLILVL
uniref:BED-type domain-containing protein n=1 Tax=Amphimedon queenslandica TaxID=400682 RepID=A0A1X7SG82_AMPQE